MAMTSQITAATEYAKKLDIDAEAHFAKHHRTRCPPKRLDENPETAAVLDLYQFFRKEFKCVLDVLVTQREDAASTRHHRTIITYIAVPITRSITDRYKGSSRNDAKQCR